MIEAVLWDNDGLLVDSEAMFSSLPGMRLPKRGFCSTAGSGG